MGTDADSDEAVEEEAAGRAEGEELLIVDTKDESGFKVVSDASFEGVGCSSGIDWLTGSSAAGK